MIVFTFGIEQNILIVRKTSDFKMISTTQSWIIFGLLVQASFGVHVDFGHEHSEALNECEDRSAENGSQQPQIHVPDSWIHAGEKSTVALHCQICASKPFTVWWTKDGEPLPETGRTREIVYNRNIYVLKLKNIREKDFGSYECNAYVNKTFREISESIQVSGVPYPAKFDLPSTWSETTFELSWRVNCSTTAPIISYRLEFRETIAPSFVGGLGSGDTGGGPDWVVINIPAPRNDDIHGATATTTLPLHHEGDDDEIFNFQSLDQSDRRRKRKHSNGHSHHQEYKQSYTLRGLSKGTSYEARVRSRNAFGMSEPSDVLHFRTFDLRQSTTSRTTEVKPIRIETVTQKPVTRKPMVFDQPEAGGLERGASSEPLSTRRNKGFAAFSSASPNVETSLFQFFFLQTIIIFRLL